MIFFLRRIFSRQNLKILLWILLAGVVIALLWLAGPHIGFGDARPLAEAAARIIVGLLILFLVLAFIAHWRWPLRMIVSACVLVWVLGPYLYLGGSYLLAGVTARLIVMTLIVGAYLLWCVVKRLRHPDAGARGDENGNESTQGASDIDTMFQQVTDSIRRRPLRFARLWRISGWRVRDDNLPWFMVLGSRGAGKTSAIALSGQHFPQTEGDESLLIHDGDPENCRCWLANEAVYLDTAGKYISDPQSSNAEWQEILRLLKKYRPSRAINGALVMVSAAELLTKESEDLTHLASVFRSRLSEMRRIPGIYFPVYIVVTQLDTLSGFAEYFRGLTRQERQDIWGISFPVGDGKSMFSQKAGEQLSQLVQRIESDINTRLLTEYDLRDRKRMYGFPGDLSVLVKNLQNFLQILFFSSRYDDTHDNSALRGVYLTSCYPHAVEEFTNPETVIQQWTDYLRHSAESSDELPAVPLATSNEKPLSQPCFLRQLFCELIIRDQALARDVTLNIAGPAMQRWLKHIAVLLMLVIVSWGLLSSYGNNSRYLQEITEKTLRLREHKEIFINDGKNEQLSRLSLLLTQFRTLPEYAGLDLQDPGLSWRYGLYTGTEIADHSDQLYQSMLRNLLLPVTEIYVTRRLQTALASSGNDDLYLNLRLYLMVFGLNPPDIPFISEELAGLWQSTLLLPVGAQSSDFNRHLKALFQQPIESRHHDQADENLIRKAQEDLARKSRAARLYTRLKQRLAGEAPQDLDLYQMTDGSQGYLFELRQGAELKAVPGLFTRQGFPLVKKKIVLQLKSLTDEDQRVMNGAVGGVAPVTQPVAENAEQLIRLHNEILNRYLDEYASLWQRYLSEIRIKIYSRNGAMGNEASQQRDLYRLGRLAAPDSPMLMLLNRLVAETTLVSDSPESRKVLDTLSSGSVASGGVREVAQQLSNTEKMRVRQRVDNHFAALRLFVTGQREGTGTEDKGSASGSALSQLLGQLSELQILLSQNRSASASATNQVKTDLASEIRTRALSWPVPIKEITLPLLNQIVSGARSKEMTRTTGEITLGPAEFCRNAFAGRYPFASSSREVSLADFERFFAPGGDADSYFTQTGG